MNARSLRLIRDVIINSGKWTSIEVSQDSIYMEFRDVELGGSKYRDEMSLTVRFAEDSFFTVFYNNIWDIEFLSKYNYKLAMATFASLSYPSFSMLTSFKISSTLDTTSS